MLLYMEGDPTRNDNKIGSHQSLFWGVNRCSHGILQRQCFTHLAAKILRVFSPNTAAVGDGAVRALRRLPFFQKRAAEFRATSSHNHSNSLKKQSTNRESCNNALSSLRQNKVKTRETKLYAEHTHTLLSSPPVAQTEPVAPKAAQLSPYP